MIRLNVNIDHVATLRNQRDTFYPSPLRAAEECLRAGADGITVHLREDRRHIRDQDVLDIRGLLREKATGVLNLEMAATAEMADFVGRVRPDVVTLVPERREERTTEGGLDVLGQGAMIERVARVCQSSDIKLSLFIEAAPAQVRASHAQGAKQVEFHTGHYCDAPESERASLLDRFREAALLAHELGLEVAAGHGLNTQNVAPIVRLPHLIELNIGHAVISDAVFLGLAGAVQELRRAIRAAIPS